MATIEQAVEAFRNDAELETINVVPFGNSMLPLIVSGSTVTLKRHRTTDPLRKGDIVLVKVTGKIRLHLVKAVAHDKVLIGNNHGRINGWASVSNVFGKVVKE